MWELDHKEGWVPKNWCFWTMVLKKTLESPLDCKEIKPVNPKVNQPWVFSRRTDAEAKALILWPLMWTANSLEKTLMQERLRAGGEGGDRGWVGWMASLTQWTCVWANSRIEWGTGGLVCCSPLGHKESDTTEWLNNKNCKKPSWWATKLSEHEDSPPLFFPSEV